MAIDESPPHSFRSASSWLAGWLTGWLMMIVEVIEVIFAQPPSLVCRRPRRRHRRHQLKQCGLVLVL